MVTHANILADVHNFNYWMRYTEGGIYLHAAPIFHIADFPSMFATPGIRRQPNHNSEIWRTDFLRDGCTRTCHSHGARAHDDQFTRTIRGREKV